MSQFQSALDAEIARVEERLAHLRALRDEEDAAPEPVASRANVRRTVPGIGGSASRIIEYLHDNPGATAGTIAHDLGLKRNSVSTRLTQLKAQGHIRKLPTGYGPA